MVYREDTIGSPVFGGEVEFKSESTACVFRQCRYRSKVGCYTGTAATETESTFPCVVSGFNLSLGGACRQERIRRIGQGQVGRRIHGKGGGTGTGSSAQVGGDKIEDKLPSAGEVGERRNFVYVGCHVTASRVGKSRFPGIVGRLNGG